MRLKVNIEVNCGAGLLLTVKKRVTTPCESIMWITQTALRGDTDIANLIGSISQHMSHLPELNTNFQHDREIQVYVNLPMGVVSIKYRTLNEAGWHICTTEFPRFMDLEAGDIWRFIEYMSYRYNTAGTMTGRLT